MGVRIRSLTIRFFVVAAGLATRRLDSSCHAITQSLKLQGNIVNNPSARHAGVGLSCATALTTAFKSLQNDERTHDER